jgi:hypothetical protein
MTLKCRDYKSTELGCYTEDGEPCSHALEHERTEWCNGLCPVVHKVKTCEEVEDVANII